MNMERNQSVWFLSFGVFFQKISLWVPIFLCRCLRGVTVVTLTAEHILKGTEKSTVKDITFPPI